MFIVSVGETFEGFAGKWRQLPAEIVATTCARLRRISIWSKHHHHPKRLRNDVLNFIYVINLHIIIQDIWTVKDVIKNHYLSILW